MSWNSSLPSSAKVELGLSHCAPQVVRSCQGGFPFSSITRLPHVHVAEVAQRNEWEGFIRGPRIGRQPAFSPVHEVIDEHGEVNRTGPLGRPTRQNEIVILIPVQVPRCTDVDTAALKIEYDRLIRS